MKNLGLSFALAVALTSARVIFTRLNRILSFCSFDHRLFAIGSPARLMIPSAPSIDLSHSPGTPGSHTTHWVLVRPTLFGRRRVRSLRSCVAARRSTSCDPIQPEAPVITKFMTASSDAGLIAWSHELDSNTKNVINSKHHARRNF